MRGDTILHKDCKYYCDGHQPFYSPPGNGELQIHYDPGHVLREGGHHQLVQR